MRQTNSLAAVRAAIEALDTTARAATRKARRASRGYDPFADAIAREARAAAIEAEAAVDQLIEAYPEAFYRETGT